MEWAWNMLRKCLDDNKYPLAQPGGIYVCSTVKGGERQTVRAVVGHMAVFIKIQKTNCVRETAKSGEIVEKMSGIFSGASCFLRDSYPRREGS